MITFTFTHVLVCLLGVIGGIVFGASPGMTATMAVAVFRFFVKFWGAKVSMHSWRGHALNTVRVLFRCVC